MDIILRLQDKFETLKYDYYKNASDTKLSEAEAAIDSVEVDHQKLEIKMENGEKYASPKKNLQTDSKPIHKTDLSNGKSDGDVSTSEMSLGNKETDAIPKRIQKVDLAEGQSNIVSSAEISMGNEQQGPIPKRNEKADLTKELSNVIFTIFEMSMEDEIKGAVSKRTQKAGLSKGRPNMVVSSAEMNLANQKKPASPIVNPRNNSNPIQKIDMMKGHPNAVVPSLENSKPSEEGNFVPGGRKEDTWQSSKSSTR
ncbi:hypothetical protein HNY73_010970 [Argiope bruennichi]|uniref:Uncharacterized protein n=1 Tax=Argiope bruennichi TaxID=94029 RepID=A0A8T0F586_ARGBR|nr:hypothetical protein HNY73_010970 [Argiope bruennichi]